MYSPCFFLPISTTNEVIVEKLKIEHSYYIHTYWFSNLREKFCFRCRRNYFCFHSYTLCAIYKPRVVIPRPFRGNSRTMATFFGEVVTASYRYFDDEDEDAVENAREASFSCRSGQPGSIWKRYLIYWKLHRSSEIGLPTPPHGRLYYSVIVWCAILLLVHLFHMALYLQFSLFLFSLIFFRSCLHFFFSHQIHMTSTDIVRKLYFGRHVSEVFGVW